MSKLIGDFLCCRIGENRRSVKHTPIQNALTTVGKARWLSLKTVNYIDFDGIEMEWDFVTRNTKKPNYPDMVIIIPILKSKMSSSIDTLIVEQYRPPIESYSCEMPTSYIGTKESPEDAALRKLKEQTGYIGTLDTTFEADELCMTPEVSDETIQMVVINVDLDDPINVNPKSQLNDGSPVVVKRIPLTTGLKGILGKSSGMAVSLLYSFAIGLEIGAKYL